MYEAKIVGCDQDDVLANLYKKWLRRYNELYDDNLDIQDVKGWNLHNFVKPECGMKIYDILEEHKFYRDLEIMPGAVEGIRQLYEDGFDVFFITSAMPIRMSYKAKFDWLKEPFPFINVRKKTVYCGDKYITFPDYHIDDATHNLDAMGDRFGSKFTGLLIDSPRTEGYDRYPRVKTVLDATNVIRDMEAGKIVHFASDSNKFFYTSIYGDCYPKCDYEIIAKNYIRLKEE
jgi:5'(3')-deoxyribonucleotidase